MAAMTPVPITISVPVGERYDLREVGKSIALNGGKAGHVVLELNFIWEETEIHNYVFLFPDATSAIEKFVKELSYWRILYPPSDDYCYDYHNKGDVEMTLDINTTKKSLNIEFEWNGDKPKKGDATLTNLDEKNLTTVVKFIHESYDHYRDFIGGGYISIVDLDSKDAKAMETKEWLAVRGVNVSSAKSIKLLIEGIPEKLTKGYEGPESAIKELIKQVNKAQNTQLRFKRMESKDYMRYEIVVAGTEAHIKTFVETSHGSTWGTNKLSVTIV